MKHQLTTQKESRGRTARPSKNVPDRTVLLTVVCSNPYQVKCSMDKVLVLTGTNGTAPAQSHKKPILGVTIRVSPHSFSKWLHLLPLVKSLNLSLTSKTLKLRWRFSTKLKPISLKSSKALDVTNST